MNNITELSRKFCEQNGLAFAEYDNPLQQFYINGVCIEKESVKYPDLTDARNVLDVCMKWEDSKEFIGSIAIGMKVSPQGCEFQLPVDLITDRTGKLLKLAVDWRNNK